MMYLFSTKAVPIDAWVHGERPALATIIDNCRRHPWHCLAEAFAFGLIIMGTVSAADWAYEMGRNVGLLIG